MLWWILDSRAHRPPARPSQNQYSHNGLRRSILRVITRLNSRSTSRLPPGAGRAVRRTCQARSKSGSSTHAGAARSSTTRRTFWRYRGIRGSLPAMEATNSSKSGAGPSKMASEPMASDAVSSTSSASRKLAASGVSLSTRSPLPPQVCVSRGEGPTRGKPLAHHGPSNYLTVIESLGAPSIDVFSAQEVPTAGSGTASDPSGEPPRAGTRQRCWLRRHPGYGPLAARWPCLHRGRQRRLDRPDRRRPDPSPQPRHPPQPLHPTRGGAGDHHQSRPRTRKRGAALCTRSNR